MTTQTEDIFEIPTNSKVFYYVSDYLEVQLFHMYDFCDHTTNFVLINFNTGIVFGLTKMHIFNFCECEVLLSQKRTEFHQITGTIFQNKLISLNLIKFVFPQPAGQFS